METDNEKLEDLLREGEQAQKFDQLEKSLGYYSEALDLLIGRAKDYAQKAEPAAMEAILGSGAMSTQYISKFNEYLKKDQTAAIVSNNMAVLFAKMGNKSSAAPFFEQAIDLTPEGVTYDAPHAGLEMLKNL
jgi:tetratricopeptide (TPR) repeat protein